MFGLEVTLLTGRYVATSYNDRSEPEWPPHPARLYSALVAAHADDKGVEEQAALDWLAGLPPPFISASSHENTWRRDLVTVFVPVNDTSVTGIGDELLLPLVEAQAALGEAKRRSDTKAVAKAEKELSKLEKRHTEGVSKALAPLDKVTKGGPDIAASLLPELRGRQPRTFPSVRPEEPRITFTWDVVLPEELRRSLECLAGRVVRLGHSSSLVSIRIIDAVPTPTWRPDDSGTEKFRVARAGQRMRLDEAYERHQETVQGRVLPCGFQGYSSSLTSVHRERPCSALGTDWLVFRRSGGSRMVMTSAAGIAKTVRSALMKFAAQPAPEIISGHSAINVPTTRTHLAIVPLPWVGSQFADGALMGLALVFPREASADDKKAVYQAVAAWERSARRDDEGTPELPVHMSQGTEWRLTRVEGPPERSSLDPRAWSRASRSWVTATPVALDRHPGDLFASDPGKRAKAIEEAEESLRSACVRLGLPKPKRASYLSSVPLAGARKARDYPRFPGPADRERRQLVHAALEFEEEIAGPILLGAGRYLGLGLFRPVDS